LNEIKHKQLGQSAQHEKTDVMKSSICHACSSFSILEHPEYLTTATFHSMTFSIIIIIIINVPETSFCHADLNVVRELSIGNQQ